MVEGIDRHWLVVISCFFLIILSQKEAKAASIIDRIVSQISQSDYISYVQGLEDFGTRYYNASENADAADYIYNEFSALGLSVAYDPFIYSGSTFNNVVATLPGTFNPDDIYIVGAHFDSTSSDPYNNAPGADDNASGVAGVLEMASVLSRYSFHSTIEFIAFNVEEKGLIGSKAYADQAKANGDKILGMLNFDMIAYTGGYAEDLDVMGDQWLVDEMISNVGAYTSLTSEAHYTNVYGSDHYYFHSSKYPGSSSILNIEDVPAEIWGGSNPYYHTPGDTSDHLDFNFAVAVTIAGAATVANLAVAVPEPSTLVLVPFGGFGLFILKRKYRIM